MTLREEKQRKKRDVLWGGKYWLWRLCLCVGVQDWEKEGRQKSRQIEGNAERQSRGRERAWQSIFVCTYTPTSESDNERQRDAEEETARGQKRMHSSSSQLSGILYLWLLLTAYILKLSVCWGCCFVLRTGWNRWSRSYLLLKCYFHVNASCSVFVFSALRDRELCPLRNCSNSMFPVCSSVRERVRARCVCVCIMCLWAIHFKMDRWKQRAFGEGETTAINLQRKFKNP